MISSSICCFVYRWSHGSWWKRVVADLVAGGGDHLQGFAVLFEGGVLADDEDGDLPAEVVEDFQEPRHDEVEVGGEGLPAGVAVGLHVGPLVVEVEGEASRWVSSAVSRSVPFEQTAARLSPRA